LKGIFGILRVPQDPAAHLEHEGAVPLHEGRERRLIAASHEAFEQQRVACFGGSQAAHRRQNLTETLPAHDRGPPAIYRYICRRQANGLKFFDSCVAVPAGMLSRRCQPRSALPTTERPRKHGTDSEITPNSRGTPDNLVSLVAFWGERGMS
jgi:hypothetical protein